MPRPTWPTSGSANYVEETQDVITDLQSTADDHETRLTTAEDVLGDASASDLEKLADITASATELNVLDGIPATLTATELGYVDGVTSAIQTQLNAKAATSHSHDIDALLPTQTGNSGKVLTTDGTDASWEEAAGGGDPDGWTELVTQLTTPVEVTATVDGTGTGIIPEPTYPMAPLSVHVVGGTDNYLITLPDADVGAVIRVIGRAGAVYHTVVTSDPATIAINDGATGSGTGVAFAIGPDTLSVFERLSATNWASYYMTPDASIGQNSPSASL